MIQNYKLLGKLTKTTTGRRRAGGNIVPPDLVSSEPFLLDSDLNGKNSSGLILEPGFLGSTQIVANGVPKRHST